MSDDVTTTWPAASIAMFRRCATMTEEEWEQSGLDAYQVVRALASECERLENSGRASGAIGRPNIRSERRDHRRCSTPREWAFEGDVRRCPHGVLQVARNVVGRGSAQWFDLSPVFNPIEYRRADRALSREA